MMEMESAAEPVMVEPVIGIGSQINWKNLVDSDSDSDFGSNDNDGGLNAEPTSPETTENIEKPSEQNENEVRNSEGDKAQISDPVPMTMSDNEKGGSGSDDELPDWIKNPSNSKQSLNKSSNKQVVWSSSDSESEKPSPLTSSGTLKVQLERIEVPHGSGTQKSSSSPKKIWETLVDTDDEEELLPIPEYYGSSSYPSKANLNGIQSDSNDSSSMGRKKGSGNSKPKEKKLTKKQRDELRKELTSKTQKMVREAPLSLPYHKPKPQTLSEFLQRRSKTKADFYSNLSGTTTLNLKNLGVPSSTMVNDWVSASAPEPVKDSPEKIDKEFNIEDFDLVDDEDCEKEASKASSVKKKLFEEDIEPDEAEIKDLIREMVDKIDDESVDPTVEPRVEPPMEPPTEPALTPLPIIKSEKVEVHDLGFETDSDLEEEFELVDLTEKDEAKTKEPLPTPKISEVEEPMELDLPEVETDKTNEVELEPPSSEPIPVEPIIDDFQAKENELIEYIRANAKPKKLTLRERLLAMPEYQNITNTCPTIKRDTNSKGLIDLNSYSKSKTSNVEKKIQTLMDRYVKHTTVFKKPKEQHFAVQVSTKEEDSQGNQKLTTNEVDYVQRDDEDADDLDNSPVRPTQGSKVDALRAKLEANIRAKKAKEYEEKLKLHAIYNDEKVLADKEEEEEVLDDEFSTESEPELTDEEMEAMKEARRKKKKKIKPAFVDEEAEVSDEDPIENYESDEDDIDGGLHADSGTDDEVILEKTYRRVQKIEDSSDEDEMDPKIALKELSPMIETVGKSRRDDDQDFETEESSDAIFSQDLAVEKREALETFRQHSESDLFADFNPDIKSSQAIETPGKTTFSSDSQITPAQREIVKLVDTETPLLLSKSKDPSKEYWKLPIVTNRQGRLSGGLSGLTPLLPRLDSNAALEALEEDMQYAQQDTPSAKVSKEISKLFDERKESPQMDDLMELCSGKFPSQAPATPAETQCTGFEFETPTNTQTPVSHPSAKLTSRRLQESQETPKGNDKERVNKTRLFMKSDSFPSESEVTTGIILSDDEDLESGIVVKPIIRKKKRRLEFSDDEDSENETQVSDVEESESEAEEPEASEKEYDSEENEIVVVKPKPVFKGLKSRAGGIRKEFVENEAELSGSEEGSGDEDERGLDELDIEEADAEEIDQEALLDGLGKQYLKRVLDDDQRDIRYLQEALLEDGDLHGEGTERQRQFKWKNLDSMAFGDNDGMEEGERLEVEDEAERLRQEEKAEKIKWMKENSHLIEDEDEEEADSQKIFLEDSQFFRLGKSTLKKIQSSCSFVEASNSNSCSQFARITSTSTTVNLTKASSSASNDVDSQGSVGSGNRARLSSQSFFASPDDPLLKMKRGSFLTRNANTLTKLAEMTKASDSNSSVKNNSRNFVFSVVTPPAPDGSQGSEGNHSKASKKPTARQQNQKSTQPKKMPRIDRSFDSLDSSSKGASIFRHY